MSLESPCSSHKRSYCMQVEVLSCSMPVADCVLLQHNISCDGFNRAIALPPSDSVLAEAKACRLRLNNRVLYGRTYALRNDRLQFRFVKEHVLRAGEFSLLYLYCISAVLVNGLGRWRANEPNQHQAYDVGRGRRREAGRRAQRRKRWMPIGTVERPVRHGIPVVFEGCLHRFLTTLL